MTTLRERAETNKLLGVDSRLIGRDEIAELVPGLDLSDRPHGQPGRRCRRFPMAVPKRKTSPSRRGMRRSADALKKPTYVEDKDSGELRRPHHIDLKTGMYRGRQVLKVKTEA